MNILDKSFKGLVVLVLVLSVFGVSDATYLTAHHYQGGSIECFILDGCDLVLSSEYAVIFGVPMALVGLIFYFILFGVSLFYLYSGGNGFLRILGWLTVPGFIFTLWLIYLQAFVLNQFCFYCIISAFLVLTLFVIGVRILVQLRR